VPSHLPLLLALLETGHARTADRDGSRIYSLTEAGQRAATAERSNTRWAPLTARAEQGEERVSIGSLLDRFAEDSRLRRRLARTEQRELIGRSSREPAPRSNERSRKERTMDELAEMAAREREARRIARRQWFWLHAAVYVPAQVTCSSSETPRAAVPLFAFPLLGWGIILDVHGVYAFVMKNPEEIMIEREVRAAQRGNLARPAIAVRVRSRAGQNAARGLYINW
jgi:hypothetical protein